MPCYHLVHTCPELQCGKIRKAFSCQRWLWFTLPAHLCWILEPDPLPVVGIALWPSPTHKRRWKSNSIYLQNPPSQPGSLDTDLLWTERGQVSGRAATKEASVGISLNSQTSYLCSQMQDRFSAPCWVKFLLHNSQIFHPFLFDCKKTTFYKCDCQIYMKYNKMKKKNQQQTKQNKKTPQPSQSFSWHGQRWPAYLWAFCFQLSAGAGAPWFEYIYMLILKNKEY